MARPSEESRKAVGRAVQVRMAELRHSPTTMADAADVDAKTIRSLVSGERWPQLLQRDRIETALGWEPGTLQNMADGVYAGDPEVDPVERAIEGSNLTRANKAKLLGMYYELLDGQGEAVTGA